MTLRLVKQVRDTPMVRTFVLLDTPGEWGLSCSSRPHDWRHFATPKPQITDNANVRRSSRRPAVLCVRTMVSSNTLVAAESQGVRDEMRRLHWEWASTDTEGQAMSDKSTRHCPPNCCACFTSPKGDAVDSYTRRTRRSPETPVAPAQFKDATPRLSVLGHWATRDGTRHRDRTTNRGQGVPEL